MHSQNQAANITANDKSTDANHSTACALPSFAQLNERSLRHVEPVSGSNKKLLNLANEATLRLTRGATAAVDSHLMAARHVTATEARHQVRDEVDWQWEDYRGVLHGFSLSGSYSLVCNLFCRDRCQCLQIAQLQCRWTLADHFGRLLEST